MISLSKVWNTSENYWVLHPAIKTIKLFKDLYDNDKSKEKIESSKLMWAIALMVDPNDANPWRTVNHLDKQKLIKTDYLEDKKFNWNDPLIKELTSEYETRCLTIGEKELVRLERKLTQRGDFLDKTDYNLENAAELDKMLLNSGKVFDQIAAIRAKMSQEEQGGTLRGGAKESASERGEI